VKIIVVAPFFRPYENPRAHRWSNIVDVWRRNGHDVQVITSHGFGDIEPEPNVHRVGFNSLKEIFQSIFPGKINRGLPNSSSKMSVFYQLFNWLNNHFWRPFYWPDEAMIWIRPATRKLLQLLDNQPVDLLVTVGLPFSAHLVGLAAKQKYPQIRWLVDIGDPLNFQPFPLNNPRFFSKKNERFETDVLAKADQISVTNAGLATIYATNFGIDISKIRVIPPIYSGELFTPWHGDTKGSGENSPCLRVSVSNNNAKNNPSRYKIGYFGSFFQNIREPKNFLEFLKKLSENQRNQLEIHFFGDIFPEFMESIDAEPLIKRHGLLSRNTVLDAMHEMDFLLNFGNATDFQLPSKSVDYRLSGLPILNFCAIKKDTFANFMSDYPLIISILPADLEISETIFTFFEHNLGKRVATNVLERWAVDFSPEKMGELYLLPQAKASGN
jgi:glycosyltransferase involved in cell wall biosynthesis